MTPRVGRRALLRTAAVGTVSLSGCAAFGDRTDSKTPRLIDLTVLNHDGEPHTFHVRIELKDETVYRESKRVEAASPDDTRAAVFTDYPTRSEPYVLSAWRDDRPEAEADILDFADFDAECLGVVVKFGTYGSDDESPDLAIFRTTNCGPGQ